MIPIKNQPFNFGYDESCDCNDTPYEQFFFDTDIIEIAFDMEICEGAESFEPEFFSAQPGWQISDNRACIPNALNSLEYIAWTWNRPAGYYSFTITLSDYQQGTITFIRQTLAVDIFIDTFSGNGSITLYAFIPNDTQYILIRSNIGGLNAFVGCVSLVIEAQEFPTNQQAFLLDSANNIVAEMQLFRRENQLFFQVNLGDLTLSQNVNYKLGWTDECSPYSYDNPEYFTNDFRIILAEQQGCNPDCNGTVALSGCYPGSQFNFPADFIPLVRVTGRLARPQYPIEFVKSRDSQGYTTINYSDRIKTMQLILDELPEYILDYLSVWVSFENMYINGQSYRITDNSFPEITYIDESDLGLVEFQVERVRQLVQRLNCTGLESPCEEVPPPPNLGTQKLFQDDVEFDFQDDVDFLFE